MWFQEAFSGKMFVCWTLTVVDSIYNTAGQSIAAIYNLGGIFTSGRTYILAIELPTILYVTYYIAKAGVTWQK